MTENTFSRGMPQIETQLEACRCGNNNHNSNIRYVTSTYKLMCKKTKTNMSWTVLRYKHQRSRHDAQVFFTKDLFESLISIKMKCVYYTALLYISDRTVASCCL